MEHLEAKGLVLGVFKDTVDGYGYLWFLSEFNFFSIKVSGDPDRSPFKHLFNPNYYLSLDLIKTRKNWILKDVYQSFKLHNGGSYQAFSYQAEVAHLLIKYLHADQEVSVLPFVLKTLQMEQPESFQLKQFEYELLKRLGFAESSDSCGYNDQLYNAKDSNNLH
jgi:hypothetical protein